ncbi:hypothetical protein V250_02283, partial [Staphylococcus aureus M32688]
LARRDAFFVTMVEPFLNHTHSVWFSFYKKTDALKTGHQFMIVQINYSLTAG